MAKFTYRENVNKDVCIGKEGWLFLAGGRNNPITYYKQKGGLNEIILQSWISLLKDRCLYFEKNNVKYIHLFVPDKLTVYPEYFNGILEYYSQHPINSLMKRIQSSEEERLSDCIINPVPYFNNQKKYYQLYPKTDTHWNFFGCYSAYQLLCSKLGVQQNADLVRRNYTEISLSMDLGGKIIPPVKEKIRFYDIINDSKRIFANEIVLLKEKNKLENEVGLHVGSHVIFRNEKSVNKKKVILFGDSFSEYRPRNLTGLLAETFQEVHFVWSTSLDYQYIKENKPDIMITEIAERFIHIPPVDKFNMKQYVEDKVKQYEIKLDITS